VLVLTHSNAIAIQLICSVERRVDGAVGPGGIVVRVIVRAGWVLVAVAVYWIVITSGRGGDGEG
jgi:hypothetical protein